MAQAVFPSQLQDILRSHELLQRPEVKRMTELDKEMADILSRGDLTPAAKIRNLMH